MALRKVVQPPKEVYTYGVGRDYGEGEWANLVADHIQGRDLVAEQKSVEIIIYKDQQEYLDLLQLPDENNLRVDETYCVVVRGESPTNKPLIHRVISGNNLISAIWCLHRTYGIYFYDLEGKVTADAPYYDAIAISLFGMVGAVGLVARDVTITNNTYNVNTDGITYWFFADDATLFASCACIGNLQGGVANIPVYIRSDSVSHISTSNITSISSTADTGVLILSLGASLTTDLNNVIIENAAVPYYEYPTGAAYTTNINNCLFNQGITFEADGITPVAGSPSIDAGVLVPGIDEDIYGITIPQGTAPDIGAVELAGGPVPPTAEANSWFALVEFKKALFRRVRLARIKFKNEKSGGKDNG